MTLALVAGATGYTGRAVVEALRRQGVPTLAHVRPDSPNRISWIERFERMGAEVTAAVWEQAAMSDLMASRLPGIVFALLGTTRARARASTVAGRPDGYEVVDYGLSRQLLDAAVGEGHHSRFVYLSSLGANPRARNPYLQVRGRFEAELKASGLPYLIARPSFITGPNRDESRPAERVAAGLMDGALALVAVLGGGRWKARYGSITNTVLADGLVRLALEPGAGSRIVDAADLR